MLLIALLYSPMVTGSQLRTSDSSAADIRAVYLSDSRSMAAREMPCSFGVRSPCCSGTTPYSASSAYPSI